MDKPLQTEIETQLKGLKAFFSTIKELPEILRLESFAVIVDVPKFIKSHIGLIEVNINKIRFTAPYLARLEKVAAILEKREKERKAMNKVA